MFLIVAIVISQLVGRVRSGLAEARAREQEVVRLYELSLALSGLHADQIIADTLARHVYEALSAQSVEVSIRSGQTPGVSVLRRLSDSVSPPSDSPVTSLPLVSPRGSSGEVRIWRTWPLNPAESRLLSAMAGQGAQALERAALVQTETRARILEESDRLKSALLSSVSHELRTPLVAIKAAATSLRSGEVDWQSAAREELLEVLEEEADRMNQLVGNLLNMSRLEAGALKLLREWNVLIEVIDSAIAHVGRVARTHHVDVVVPDDLPLVPIDPVLMEQVFVNLISNSVKYAPPGTTICIEARHEADQTLLVRVSNESPPVPEAELEHIFDRFHRVTTADRVPGTGLGLSICKGIVEAHGGHIRAENLPEGFAFVFTLPLVWEGASPPQLPAETESL